MTWLDNFVFLIVNTDMNEIYFYLFFQVLIHGEANCCCICNSHECYICWRMDTVNEELGRCSNASYKILVGFVVLIMYTNICFNATHVLKFKL